MPSSLIVDCYVLDQAVTAGPTQSLIDDSVSWISMITRASYRTRQRKSIHLIRRLECEAGHFAPDYLLGLSFGVRGKRSLVYPPIAVRFVMQERFDAGLHDIRVSDQIRLCAEKGPRGPGPLDPRER